ncbi:MAG: GNAT family N-acetyltransferase [Bacteroidota bacterium]|nr:MAG: GNAT family N-acetyltransferase [Bacteroidota bacterium]
MPVNQPFQIILRALEPEDIEYLYRWENDPQTWKVSNTISPFSRSVLNRYIENAHLDIFQTRQLRLMIDVKEDSLTKTVGAIDLFDFEPLHLRVGAGILIGEAAERGKGYAQESLKKLCEYAFEVMQLHQVYCNIMANNEASLKLFQQLGFEQTGNKKEWIKTPEGYVDEWILQKINPRDRV